MRTRIHRCLFGRPVQLGAFPINRGTFHRNRETRRSIAAGILPVVLFLLTAVPAFSQEPVLFRYNTAEEMSYRLVSTNQQSIALNGFVVREAEIITRVQMDPGETIDGMATYQAVFTLTENTRQPGRPVGIESQYTSEFARGPLGHMEIDDRFIMPVARDFPVFPERPIAPGETWTAESREVHDLSAGYDLSEPLRFSFPVSYRYEGVTTWNQRQVHLIEADYNIFHREQRDALLYPEIVSGQSRQQLYWDAERGRLVGSSEEYFIEFRLSDGRRISYQGTATTDVLDAQPLDRPSVVDVLQRRLNEAGIENTRVTDDEAGVVLVLENIGFPPDSAELLTSERERLAIIAGILADYPDNDLLISGHTALAGTAGGRDQLSIDRALAVGEFFLSEGARSAEQILYRGFGATRPIADNATAEGRRRNRRVEIMVLDN